MEYKRTTLQELAELATQECISLGRKVLQPEHLLLAMLKSGGIETEALITFGANYPTFRRIVVENMDDSDQTITGVIPSVYFRSVLSEAQNLADKNEDGAYAEYALIRLIQLNTGTVNTIFRVLEIDKKALIRFIQNKMKVIFESNKTSNLEKYGKNLNKLALSGEIDPVVGRDREIERMIQILSRRTKNNPVLIGDPGVGKTAIVEGLAQKIVSGEIADIMLNKTIYSIDMASMVAGTKYRGDFEQRLTDTLDELMRQENAIVFIDELHTIMGAGASDGALDASNILKPSLAKGKLQMIGATTIDEYRKRIEKDSALERRFQPVMIDEPTKEETILILKGLRENYESFHDAKISDEAIEAAVDLTDRYLSDRFFPDKAIDVIDEAQARVHVKEFHISPEIKQISQRIEELEESKNKAALRQDFETAASLRDEKERLIESRNQLLKMNREKKKVPVIQKEDIAKIVSDWAKVPVTKMTQQENDSYLNLSKNLKKIVIGQDYAIEAVSSSIKRARVGLKSSDRPIGSFIFVGPTGVGKTFLAKSLAKLLFGDEKDMIRIDMSEYMEKYTVSRLIGAAPGYVGYDEGGQLTDAVRSKPYSVILFDEIEKAHPDVFNILLQLLDDGRLTDSKGRTVDFKNTVIIMTSNVGATKFETPHRLGFGQLSDLQKADYDNMKNIVESELKNTFKPEFLNRIDDVVLFNRLDQSVLKSITKLLLNDLIERVEKLGYRLRYTDAVCTWILDKAYKPEYGARPLEREIRNSIENNLSEWILSKKLKKTKSYVLSIQNGEVNLKED